MTELAKATLIKQLCGLYTQQYKKACTQAIMQQVCDVAGKIAEIKVKYKNAPYSILCSSNERKEGAFLKNILALTERMVEQKLDLCDIWFTCNSEDGKSVKALMWWERKALTDWLANVKQLEEELLRMSQKGEHIPLHKYLLIEGIDTLFADPAYISAVGKFRELETQLLAEYPTTAIQLRSSRNALDSALVILTDFVALCNGAFTPGTTEQVVSDTEQKIAIASVSHGATLTRTGCKTPETSIGIALNHMIPNLNVKQADAIGKHFGSFGQMVTHMNVAGTDHNTRVKLMRQVELPATKSRKRKRTNDTADDGEASAKPPKPTKLTKKTAEKVVTFVFGDT